MSRLERRMDRRTFLKYSAAACSAACLGWKESFAATGQKADLVLTNGKILTVDRSNRIAEAVAVQGDKILKVGKSKQISSLIGPNTNVIDLEGKTVTPGLVDAHFHMMGYGRQFWPGFVNIRFPRVNSLGDLLKAVQDKAKTTPAGHWISGNQGFFFSENTEFDRWILDGVVPNHPVYLRHGSGQYSVVNSLALQLAGINKSTPDPFGGKIMRDATTGEPTGVLLHYPAENLVMLLADGYGELSDQEMEDDIKRAQDLCLAAGITSAQDVIVGSVRQTTVYKNLADRDELKVRVYILQYVDSEDTAEQYADWVKGIEDPTGDWATFGGWKLAVDGGIAAGTTLMYNQNLYAARYAYDYYEPEALNRVVRLLHDTGFQVAFHIIGDKGTDEALAALEAAMKASPRRDPRHRIEHAVYVDPKSFARIKKLGVVISTQPQWISWHGDGYRSCTDEAAMANFIRIGTMVKKKIPVAFGCDVPAAFTHDPKWAFIAATTRETASGYVPGPEECIDMKTALKLHTMGSAYAAFEENLKGSIEAGKWADLVVWSHDLYSMTSEEMMELEALVTIVGGQIVYERE